MPYSLDLYRTQEEPQWRMSQSLMAIQVLSLNREKPSRTRVGGLATTTPRGESQSMAPLEAASHARHLFGISDVQSQRMAIETRRKARYCMLQGIARATPEHLALCAPGRASSKTRRHTECWLFSARSR